MSIAELVPTWKALPDPSGRVIPGSSLKKKSYRLRNDKAIKLDATGILMARDFDGDHEEFLSPTLRKHTPDPSLLMDMDIAAQRLARAIIFEERVVIFGDYDVDGASASAVLGRWFASFGIDYRIYIPDRFSEGYGPSEIALSKALSEPADLLICVDCGTASGHLLDDLEIDTIVIDHHKQQGDLPNIIATVNPHRLDDTSGLGMLCATGLAFLAVVAANRELKKANYRKQEIASPKNLLDVVAIATVADVVPLVGPSRLFVSRGLVEIESNPSIGVKALMNVAGLSEISSGKIGFTLGPRINAGGRVGGGSSSENGALGSRLLISSDHVEASNLASQLNSMNLERQEIQKFVQEDAFKTAETQISDGARLVAVYSESWHTGVVGIVAGRIKERFDVPVLVAACENDIIKGSGRSVPGFDLGAVIVEAKKRGILVSGGGHAMACGFGCHVDRWEEFISFARSRAKWDEQPNVLDCEIDFEDIHIDGIRSLKKLEPFGQGNPNVKAAVRNFLIRDIKELKNGHLKLFSKSETLEGVWWKAKEEGFLETIFNLKGKRVTIIGSPSINSFRGRESISVEISDIILE
jgi:single-stranded-DNA-specific exonuclease